MKKRFFALALCAAVLLTLHPVGLAAGADSGFYNVGEAEGIEIRPVTASGEAVPGTERDADGDGAVGLSRSTAQKNINIDILSKIAFPLPPLAEQKRIVAKLEELLPLCERLK